jgi:DNA-binding NarL/FixJ family response regulator
MAQHILIIDADPVAGAVTGALVRRIAPDATVAVEPTPYHGGLHAQRHSPDVLIIDPVPVSASVLVIGLCREQNANLRVVVLPSVATPSLQRHLQPVGIDVYVAKPIASVPLVDQLRPVLTEAVQPASQVEDPADRRAAQPV